MEAQKAVCEEAYQEIMDAWDKGDGMNDMYHHILAFMETEPQKVYPQLKGSVKSWMKRANRGDETNDLVEDFLFTFQYSDIRNCFYKEESSESESDSSSDSSSETESDISSKEDESNALT